MSSRNRGGVTNYVAVVGDETVWPLGNSLSMEQISDGAKRTILIVEYQGGEIPWTEPRDLKLDTMSMQIGSPSGISSRFDPPAVVTADGSVHTLSLGLPQQVVRGLLTARGGDEVPFDANLQKVPDGRNRPLRSP
jgi:hypothetical protein